MNRTVLVAVVALLAGVAGFLASRHPWGSRPPDSPVSIGGPSVLPELEWLRREFELTDTQFAKVSELHASYRPTCESLCARVIASHDKVKRLADSGTRVSPELRSALEEHASLHAECQAAMLDHLYRTAACLSPGQARDYLDAMVPHTIEMTMEPKAEPEGR